jgi:Protein of unknown function (DUF3147)
MREILLRMVIGGIAVSAFSQLGDLLRPKSFAGLLGAAPSVALATLALTAMKEGNQYASVEARSMILGAIAFIFYESVVSQLLIRRRYAVLPVTGFSLVVWFAGAFGLWYSMARMAW